MRCLSVLALVTFGRSSAADSAAFRAGGDDDTGMLQVAKTKDPSGLCPRSQRHSGPGHHCPKFAVVIPNAYERAKLNEIVRMTGAKEYQTGGFYFERGLMDGIDVVMVTCGLAMVNSAAATTLAIELYNPETVMMYGIAGAVSSSVNFADVVVTGSWVTSGLFVWTRAGYDSKTDALPLEGIDYSRDPPSMEFTFPGYKQHPETGTFYVQPSEIMKETSEDTGSFRKEMYLKVDPKLLVAAEKVAKSGFELPKCLADNSKCLAQPPVLRVLPNRSGSSASIYVDNAAWSAFLEDKLSVIVTDMETAAASHVCKEFDKPFIAFRSASDKAGASAAHNEADEFIDIAAGNAAIAMVAVMKEVAKCDRQ